jgi:hypothetical protein
VQPSYDYQNAKIYHGIGTKASVPWLSQKISPNHTPVLQTFSMHDVAIMDIWYRCKATRVTRNGTHFAGVEILDEVI